MSKLGNWFLSIRLSYIYPLLFIFFMLALTFIEPDELSAGQLALFSVNSFLFGYFFGPILDSQKNRVRDLADTVRQENMAIMDILAQSHLLPEGDRHTLKVKLAAYVDSLLNTPPPDEVGQHLLRRAAALHQAG